MNAISRMGIIVLLATLGGTIGCKSLRDEIRGEGVDGTTADWSVDFRAGGSSTDRGTGLTEKARDIERNLGYR